MIKSIWIDNFKSLVDFKLEPAKFTCLVGLNGAGKTTVLQAMDFLSHLMEGDISKWLKQLQWTRRDINSKLTAKNNIDFEIIINTETNSNIIWTGSVNRNTLNCTKEHVKISNIEKKLLNVDDGHCSIAKMNDESGNIQSIERFPVVFEYQGSILSQLKEKQINPILKILKETILEIRPNSLLSPNSINTKTLKEKLSVVYKQLNSIHIKSLSSGNKQLEIIECYNNHILKFNTHHTGTGILHLITVLTQLESDNGFLLFDEIENGINPELIEYLIDLLVTTKQQIIVTTHSPMILNFLDDAMAKEGIIYLYKTKQGYTKSIKFFDIPSMGIKLNVMGPGEVFVDTDLTNLYPI